MLIDPAKLNVKEMTRDQLSEFVVRNDEIKYKNYIAEIEGSMFFDKYITLIGNQGSDEGIRAIASGDVQITRDDIEFLTDYENNKELVDEKTGVRNLSLGDFKAWLNTYIICVKRGNEIIYLPILKSYNRIEEGGDLRHRYPVLSELMKASTEKVEKISSRSEILKAVYEELEEPKGKSEIPFQELSSEDKKEFYYIIEHNVDGRYEYYNKQFSDHFVLPFQIYKLDEKGHRIALKKKDEVSKDGDITRNAWFAINGLPRINVVKGKLYINRKEVDKAKYYARNIVQ